MDLKPAQKSVKENDLILVYIEEKPAFFARVEGFTPDRKPKWWHVKLLILNIPLQVVTWILRLEQLNGVEPFTMGGTAIRIEKVVAPKAESGAAPAKDKTERKAKPKASRKKSEGRQASILTLGEQKKGGD